MKKPEAKPGDVADDIAKLRDTYGLNATNGTKPGETVLIFYGIRPIPKPKENETGNGDSANRKPN
jgi:hypothetical protein